MPSRVTGDRTRARRAGRALAPRAGRALAASLALAAIGLPAALLAGHAPAATAATAAAGRRQAQSQVKLAITKMTPGQAVPGATITVTGTVSNRTRQPISNLSVQLLGSSTAVTTPAELQPGSTAQNELAGTPLPGGTWKPRAALQPGRRVRWIVQVKANSIGMTTFGVYPLTAQAQTPLAQLAATTTYLPYVPAKNGPYGRTIPARTKISWVLPLIGKPQLDEPWQNPCQGAQAEALATSLGNGGRLGQLLAVGGDSVATADVYSATAGPGRAAQGGAIRSKPTQSLSSYDGITWAIDPALLANVNALAGCSSSHAGWANTARSWLADLRQITSAEPVFVTPYADPDVAALVDQKHQDDVIASSNLGTAIGQSILGRNLGSSVARTRSRGALSPAAGVAWPADGISGYSTLEALGSQNVQTLLLSSAALPRERSTVLRTLAGGGSGGGYMDVLLANQSLTRLLATGSTAHAAFATAQDFLAETALAAQQDPGAPIIVAPPRRFDPAAGLTAKLLAETALAPWLSPVSLPSLTTGKHIPDVPNPVWAASPTRIAKHELQKLTKVDELIAQLQNLAANPAGSPGKNFSLAVATAESSAWQGRSAGTALAMLRTLTSEITQQEHGVQIYAEPRVTLGGLKGTVPVSIDNRLGYKVRVQLRLDVSSANGVQVTTDPPGVVTVPGHEAVTVRLHVQATRVGSTKVTMSLLNWSGQTLPVQAKSMTIEATQVGVLGVIICAVALGIFLIAYAARAVRRDRPAGDAEQPADTSAAADQGGDRSTVPAEADTVMPERSELGTAGATGP